MNYSELEGLLGGSMAGVTPKVASMKGDGDMRELGRGWGVEE